jgi:hypothetical protein
MDLLNPINNTTQPMPESQGSPQNTKEASPKRDNKKTESRGYIELRVVFMDIFNRYCDKKVERCLH